MTRECYDATAAERRVADLGMAIDRQAMRDGDRTIFEAVIFDIRSMILLSRRTQDNGHETSVAMSQIESRILSRISFALLTYAARLEREPSAYDECRQCCGLLRELEKLALDIGAADQRATGRKPDPNRGKGSVEE